MANAGQSPGPKDLVKFRLLANCTPQQLALLAETLIIRSAPQGTLLIQNGSSDPFSLFLMKGELELISSDAAHLRISADSESAKNAIANLLPRRYDVVSVTPVEYLEIDSHLLEKLRAAHAPVVTDNEDSVFYQTGDYTALVRELINKIKIDLAEERLRLPLNSKLVKYLIKAIDAVGGDSTRVTLLAQFDPCIAVRLLKEANSNAYQHLGYVASCPEAVDRLGSERCRKIMVTEALIRMNQLDNPELLSRMETILDTSQLVAELASVLAKMTGQFRTDQARLAGLLHDLGGLVTLAYAHDYQELVTSRKLLDRIMPLLRWRIGAMILKYWRLPDAFAVVAKDVEVWKREPKAEAELVDLITVAKAHSYIGMPEQKLIPPIDQLPVMKRLNLEDLTPKKSWKVLEYAKVQMASNRLILFE